MIWDYKTSDKSGTLDSHAGRLRRLLEAAGTEGRVVNCWGSATGLGSTRALIRTARELSIREGYRALGLVPQRLKPSSSQASLALMAGGFRFSEWSSKSLSPETIASASLCVARATR